MNISKVSLDEIFWFQEGPGVRNWQFQKEGIKLLNVANIEKNGQLNLAKTDRHLAPDEANGKYAHFLLDEGDLVIASSGISFDTDGMLRTRGAFVEREHLPLCLNTSTIRFKPKDGRSDLKFLRHWLDGSEFRGQITKLVTGSAQQNFGPTHLKALRISVPPLEEQRRIAAILDQAETLRTQRRTALALLDSLTQSLFLDMFGDAETNRMGFQIATLGNAIKLKSGNFLPASQMAEKGQFPVYGGNGINGKHDEFMFEEPKIVIGRVGAYCGCVHVTEPRSWVTDNALYIETFDSAIHPEYLAFALSEAKLNQYASQSGQPLISGTRIAAVKLLIPPLPLQQTFATRIASIEALKATHPRALAALDALFASLQQRAFAGAL